VWLWLWLWLWLFRVFFMKWMNEWRLLYKVARRETTGMRAFVLWPDVSADQSPACLALSISPTQTRWGRPLLKEQTTTRARCLVFIMYNVVPLSAGELVLPRHPFTTLLAHSHSPTPPLPLCCPGTPREAIYCPLYALLATA
jgi:hypothetical protein